MQDYKQIFCSLFDTLNLPKLDSNCYLTTSTYLLEHSTVQLDVPRCSGKTEFINANLRNGDVLLTRFSYRTTPYDLMFSVSDGKNIENLQKLHGRRIRPSRYVFADEVTVTGEMLEKLMEYNLVDSNTKVFSLSTSVT
jgi:hypothetical protein